MKKENEFLINLILSRYSDESAYMTKELINDNLDWEYLSHQIIMQRIGGIVAENLIKLELLHDVPKSIKIYLCDTYTSIQYRFNNYKHDLSLLLETFEKSCIKYVIVKGIHLSLSLYSDFKHNPRDFADLDIVVLKNSLDNVINLLEENGYNHARINYYTDELETIKRSEILNGKMFYHQIPPLEKKFEPYFIGRNSYKIDVNYTIFEGGQHEDPIPISDLLESRILQDIDNIHYYSLRPEDDLIQNCFHFYKDIMFPPKNKSKDTYKLINFYDILLLFHKYKDVLDYSYLLEKAKSNHKIEQSLYIAVCLTERLFGDMGISSFFKKLDNTVPDYIKELFNKDIETIVFESKRFNK